MERQHLQKKSATVNGFGRGRPTFVHSCFLTMLDVHFVSFSLHVHFVSFSLDVHFVSFSLDVHFVNGFGREFCLISLVYILN